MTRAKAANRRTGTRKRVKPDRSASSERGGARSTPEPATNAAPGLVAQWPFPAAASLGSSVRLQGIEREIRARLPWLVRNGLTVESGRVHLTMPESDTRGFEEASTIVAEAIGKIDTLPVLPGEAEDILTITAHERQKWLKDGRLRSAGTRTVKLRGRAKAVTFHVFDPRDVEDVLDRDLPAVWRAEDARTIAENRRRAAGKAALTRAGKGRGQAGARDGKRARADTTLPKLADWESFALDGLLR